MKLFWCIRELCPDSLPAANNGKLNYSNTTKIKQTVYRRFGFTSESFIRTESRCHLSISKSLSHTWLHFSSPGLHSCCGSSWSISPPLWVFQLSDAQSITSTFSQSITWFSHCRHDLWVQICRRYQLSDVQHEKGFRLKAKKSINVFNFCCIRVISFLVNLMKFFTEPITSYKWQQAANKHSYSQ